MITYGSSQRSRRICSVVRPSSLICQIENASVPAVCSRCEAKAAASAPPASSSLTALDTASGLTSEISSASPSVSGPFFPFTIAIAFPCIYSLCAAARISVSTAASAVTGPVSFPDSCITVLCGSAARSASASAERGIMDAAIRLIPRNPASNSLNLFIYPCASFFVLIYTLSQFHSVCHRRQRPPSEDGGLINQCFDQWMIRYRMTDTIVLVSPIAASNGISFMRSPMDRLTAPPVAWKKEP